jgi:predicted transposase/invertase (TIGR01784 family)
MDIYRSTSGTVRFPAIVCIHRHYEKRILYYGCKLHQQQLHEGDDYLELKPTISISFLNHVLFPETPAYHLRFLLRDREHELLLTDNLEFHLLELPKFNKTVDELVTVLDLWLYFLRHGETMDREKLPPVIANNPLLVRAWEELKMLAQNDLELERYEARRKAQLDYITGLKVARLEGIEEGEIIGRQEGEKIGRQEGEKIGQVLGKIHLCERLLQRPETPAEHLASMTLEELTRLAEELQALVLQKH